jgi:hypothetical protein
MAREVYGAHTEWTGAPLERLEQLVALVRADERKSFIAEMQAQIDHAVINDLRLTPNFGKQKGDLAVRVSSIEAALDAIRARGNT